MNNNNLNHTVTLSEHPTSPYFAAIDLGSNSFHMLIVKVNDGILETVDRVKEMVQVARGLSASGELAEGAQERALHCLRCFQERIRDIPAEQIRVVGTKALRSANNANRFISLAEAALGHPIDIISGYEEARLVYLGVSRDMSADKGKQLVIDIGGGSTEFIIGAQRKTQLLESLSIGCVTFSDRYLRRADNPLITTEDDNSAAISPAMINATYYATCLELELISRKYLAVGWDIAVGSSGTMRAIAKLMPDTVMDGIITRTGLLALKDTLVQQGGLPELSGLSPERHNVLPTGIIILSAIFNEFKLDEIHVANATLKEGLIYDTIGRLSTADMRDHTVNAMMQQYQVEPEQAARINHTLSHFAQQLPTPIVNGLNVKKVLHWAVSLHEIGLSVSHSGYHHHGYYLLKNSDMAGFSRFEQELLALLVGSHRRKIRTERLQLLTADKQSILAPLVACLRLAVVLHRNRDDINELPNIHIQMPHIHLQFSEQWLEQHPLTYHNLSAEQRYLESLNIMLDY